MRKGMRMLSAALCVTLLASGVSAAETDSLEQQIQESGAGLSALGGAPGQLLSDHSLLPAGNSGSDWTAIALALSGTTESYDAYLEALREEVETRYAEDGVLDANLATEYHRISLTVMALGGDPTSFGEKPDGSSIDLIADGTYDYAGDSLGTQGLNGWIWALITLDAQDTEIPEDAVYQREDIISAILDGQESDGGFSLIPGTSDIDITAMALQALAPYQETCEEEIDAALTYLSGQLTDDCGFVSYGDENAESTAQVILALCALGKDPEEEEQFIRNGNTLLDELGRFRLEDGTYGHLLTDETADYLATPQAVFALTAVQRLRNGQDWVFRFGDGISLNQHEKNNRTIVIAAAAVIAAAVLGTAVIVRKRKKNGKINRSDSE